MKRVKKKKSNKSKQIVLNQSKLNKLKKDVTKEAIDKSCLLLLAAATDELNLNEEQICNIMIRTNRYAGYIDDHLSTMQNIQKSIEDSAGIKLIGW